MKVLSIISIGATLLALTLCAEGTKLGSLEPSMTRINSLETRQDSESLIGCSQSSLGKCYGAIPEDGTASTDMIEEIGQIADAQTCQKFCKELYASTCQWFMFDRTTRDCKLFSSSLDDLWNDCREVGYAMAPKYDLCDQVFPANSTNGCYNFREDYCRFEFSLIENLEHIDSLSECQMACEYVSNCTYFLYDRPSKTCKIETKISQKTCDIIHGTPEPDFNTCMSGGLIPWVFNSSSSPNEGSNSTNPSSPTVDCEWGSYSEWSPCSVSCGDGEKSRTRPVATAASNGGQDCEGEATESEACNAGDCPVNCEWGSYGDWSSCSVSCGDGEKSRTRPVAIAASNGGQACAGNATETMVCNEVVCPVERSSCLELSKEQVSSQDCDPNDCKLVLHSQIREPISTVMNFTEGEMHGNSSGRTGKYVAWGFSANVWRRAGLTDLNGGWTMRFDFVFPDAINWNEFVYVMFNEEPRNLGQKCDICFPWDNHHNTYRGDLKNKAKMIVPANNWDTNGFLQHKNRPFSFLFSRNGDTGYINIKLYRRDTSELQMELEIEQNVQFDDENVPVAFYFNNAYADWNSVSLRESTDVPSLSSPCTS